MKKLLLLLGLTMLGFYSNLCQAEEFIKIHSGTQYVVGDHFTLNVSKQHQEEAHVYIAVRMTDGRLLWLDRANKLSAIQKPFAFASSPRADNAYLQVFSLGIPDHLVGKYTVFAGIHNGYLWTSIDSKDITIKAKVK